MVSLKRKFYLALGIIFVFLFVLVFVFILPIIDKIVNKSDSYIELDNKLVKMEKEIESLDSRKKDFRAAQNSFLVLDGAFLDREQAETVEFISSLEQGAKDFGIDIDIVSVTSSENFSTFQINIQGEFSKIFNFIAFLEYQPQGIYRLIEIKNVEMKGVGGSGETAEIGSEESEEEEEDEKKEKRKSIVACNIELGVHLKAEKSSSIKNKSQEQEKQEE